MPNVRVINPIINTEPSKLRMAAYCRVSSDSADQQNSFLAQVQHYTQLISENPEWELADIYADEAITGTRTDIRHEFQRLLRDCRYGKIDRVLTKSISRFSRNTKDCLESVRALTALGVSVYFQKEEIDTSLMGDEMMLGILASMAQEESISISGNVRLSYERRMRKGEFVTCSPAYGYQLVENNLVVDEQEAAVVNRIFTDYLMGKGVSEIADELTAAGIPTKNGNQHWNHTAVTYILKNEKYIGDAIVQKTYTTNTLPFRHLLNKGEIDRYYIKNTQASLIHGPAYEQVNRLLENRRLLFRPVNKQIPQPLSRKILCGECGSSFKRKCRADKLVYWVCRGHDQSKLRCSLKQIPETEIHAAFMRMWAKLKQNHRYILRPLLDGLIALNSKSAMNNAKIGEIDKEISELNGQNLVLNRLRSKGYMDSAIFMENSNKISARVSTLRKKRHNLMEIDEDDDAIAELNRLIEIMESNATPAGFDEYLFGSIIQKIIVSAQDKLTFRLLGGLELTEPIPRSVR